MSGSSTHVQVACSQKVLAVSYVTVVNSQSPASPADDFGVIIMSDAAAVGFLFVFLALVVVVAMQSSINKAEKERKEKNQKLNWQAEKKGKIKQKINEVFNIHKKTLLLKYDQLTYRDDYGQLVTDDFKKELKYFLEKTVFSPFMDAGIYIDEDTEVSSYNYLVDLIFDNLLDPTESKEPITEEKIETGEEYERFIGSLVENFGWDVKYTPQTGDQGIDIIANKNGQTVAIQCKFYSSPVGNAAIQEAYSGAKFYNAHQAMVITSSSFTKSAKQLASSLGVLYFHHSAIDDFFSDKSEGESNCEDYQLPDEARKIMNENNKALVTIIRNLEKENKTDEEIVKQLLVYSHFYSMFAEPLDNMTLSKETISVILQIVKYIADGDPPDDKDDECVLQSLTNKGLPLEFATEILDLAKSFATTYKFLEGRKDSGFIDSLISIMNYPEIEEEKCGGTTISFLVSCSKVCLSYAEEIEKKEIDKQSLCIYADIGIYYEEADIAGNEPPNNEHLLNTLIKKGYPLERATSCLEVYGKLIAQNKKESQ